MGINEARLFEIDIISDPGLALYPDEPMWSPDLNMLLEYDEHLVDRRRAWLRQQGHRLPHRLGGIESPDGGGGRRTSQPGGREAGQTAAGGVAASNGWRCPLRPRGCRLHHGQMPTVGFRWLEFARL